MSSYISRRARRVLAPVLASAVILVVVLATPVLAAPAITGFSPTSGPAGTNVSITGSGFSGASSVQFNGVAAVFTVNSDTQITATVPAGATTGPISVTTSSGSTTSSSPFTVAAGISGFAPNSGAVGDCVAISGSGFTGATEVKFGSTASPTFTVDSDNSITASVPTGATSGPISVTTASGTLTTATNFTVSSSSTAPTICSVTPTTGGIGDTVTITGTNFTGATVVRFAGSTATYTVDSATQITTTIPNGAISGRITVSTPSGTATSATDFIVQQPANAPTVASFTPTSGPVGTLVTIDGSGYNNVIAVKFNGVSASSTRQSNSVLNATVPAGASTGKISVTTSNGTGISATDFVVTENIPTVTSFAPTSGPPGTTVFINGSDFASTTTVTFNGVSAQFTVTSSTQITATVPAGATTGPIAVTNAVGTGTSPQSFTVSASSGAPAITSFSPTSGSPGIAVTITGTALTGATAVKFNATPATFTVVSDSQINTTVPTGATTGAISVTTPSGTATSAQAFTVTAVVHGRGVTLALSGSLVAKGAVSVADGFTACLQSVPVKIQKRVSGKWRTIASTSTDGAGSYRKSIRNRAGRYRAKAPKVIVGSDTCRRAISPVKTR